MLGRLGPRERLRVVSRLAFPAQIRMGVASVGGQRCALNSKHQVQPLVGYGFTPEEHFQACVQVAKNHNDPWESDVTPENDLKFAADMLLGNWENLRRHMRSIAPALRELGYRCKGLDKHLRSFQSAAVRRSAHPINIGFMVLAIIIMGWPDWMPPLRFIIGFQVVGRFEESHIWSSASFVEP